MTSAKVGEEREGKQWWWREKRSRQGEWGVVGKVGWGKKVKKNR